MSKPFLSYCVIILALFLSGCSIDISQQSVPAAQAGTTPVPPSLIAPSAGSVQKPKIGNSALPNRTVPVTWSSLHLTGTLVYMSSLQTQSFPQMSVQALDLTTGAETTIFQAPTGAWIDFASVSPDGKQLIMAYLPPRDNNTPSTTTAQQGLYVMPLDASKPPQLLFNSPSANYQYYQPVWSPDGKSIYFAMVDYGAPPSSPSQHYPDYQVFRMPYPAGQPVKLADQAYWPRLSSDGARLAYVTLDPNDGTNKLFVANADGSGAYQVQLTGLYVPPIIDAPFFTPGDGSVLYSAVTPTQSSRPNWLDRILGIIDASAHTVPSDWWSVPIGGGTPTQLTHIAAVGLYASLSPDQKYIASYSGSGIFVMNADGTGLNILINDNGSLSGTLSWIP